MIHSKENNTLFSFIVACFILFCLCVFFFSAARDAEALEREIAMLSERYGEAAAEAKNNGKILLEKEALLDAVTAQVFSGVV